MDTVFQRVSGSSGRASGPLLPSPNFSPIENIRLKQAS